MADATLPGQLYGLCGLLLVDEERFVTAVEPHLVSDETVDTFRGCLAGRVPVATVAVEIASGDLPRALRAVDVHE